MARRAPSVWFSATAIPLPFDGLLANHERATVIGRRGRARWSCASPSCARAPAPASSSRAAWLTLTAVIREAYIQGVSTRSVDELVKSMGISGISKSQVSRLCEEIDERVEAFLERPLEGEWPYLWIDATYLKVRQAGRIVSVAVTIAVGVNTDGRREDPGPGHRPVGSRDLLDRLFAQAWQGGVCAASSW